MPSNRLFQSIRETANALACLGATAACAFAQNPAPTPDLRDLGRMTAPTTDATRFSGNPSVASPASAASYAAETAESEFGEQRILQRRAHVEPWSASAGIDLFRTDNVALTSKGEQDDWYLRYGMAASYTNRVRGPLFFDVSLQHYLFRYSEFDVLDFDLTRLDTGFLLQLPKLADTFFFGRYRLEYLTSPGFGDDLLTNHTADFGLQKIWKVSRGQQVFAHLSAAPVLSTDPGSSARDEYSVSLGYSLRLTERISTSISYRGSFFHYRERSREDWNHVLAASVTYDATDWLRLGITAAYTENLSNTPAGEYRNLTPGAGFLLRIAF